jgi:hypothetical protein
MGRGEGVNKIPQSHRFGGINPFPLPAIEAIDHIWKGFDLLTNR